MKFHMNSSPLKVKAKEKKGLNPNFS